jgi:hypothetical protein
MAALLTSPADLKMRTSMFVADTNVKPRDRLKFTDGQEILVDAGLIEVESANSLVPWVPIAALNDGVPEDLAERVRL